MQEQANIGKIESVQDNEDGTYTITVDNYVITIQEKTLEIIEIEKLGARPTIQENSITILQEDDSLIPSEGVEIGTKLKINFTASIEGGEIIEISPSVPYVTNGEEKQVTFKITGKIQEEIHTIEKTIKLDDKYKKPPVFTKEDIMNVPLEFIGKSVTGYNCDKQNACGWKILYADENNIYLIADDYVHYQDVPAGKRGTTVTKNTDYCLSFNSIISDYTGTADITDERIKKLNSDYFSKGYTSQNINMKIVAYMLDTEAWNGYKGEKAEYAIGGPTVELLYKSYNQKNSKSLTATAPSAVGYTWTTAISGHPLINSTKAKSMWVASSYYGRTTDHIVTMYNAGYLSGDLYTRTTQGLCPVVCLNSDVQLEKKIDGNYKII